MECIIDEKDIEEAYDEYAKCCRTYGCYGDDIFTYDEFVEDLISDGTLTRLGWRGE